MRLAYLCDFDGTVAPADVGAAFVRRFSTAGEDEAEALTRRWREGQIGSREVIQTECGWLEVTREEALEFVRSFALDPGFAPFAEFPFDGAGCGRCGNCKGAHVLSQKAEGYEVVLVGDGLSDRCGAEVADHVLARGELLSWCRSKGIASHPFSGFADVARFARGLPGRRPRPEPRPTPRLEGGPR
jgi:2-hydroxy-3-keto-5-methylthiopentenyl-1-phosphate phosphatase